MVAGVIPKTDCISTPHIETSSRQEAGLVYPLLALLSSIPNDTDLTEDDFIY